MRLGLILRKYRVVSEITLREFGQKMGISAATLLRIEQGKECDSFTLTKVLMYLLHREVKL